MLGSWHSSRAAPGSLEEPHDLEESTRPDALRSRGSLRSASANLVESHNLENPAQPGGPGTDTLGSWDSFRSASPSLEESYDLEEPARPDALSSRGSLRSAPPSLEEPHDLEESPGPTRSGRRIPCDRLSPVSRSPTGWKGRPARSAQIAALLAIAHGQSRGVPQSGQVPRAPERPPSSPARGFGSCAGPTPSRTREPRAPAPKKPPRPETLGRPQPGARKKSTKDRSPDGTRTSLSIH